MPAPVGRPPDIKWLDRPLQGLAYWMGLRDCYFDNYWLGESALVAEFCNLLAAKAPGRAGKRMVVAPEHPVAYLEGKPLPKKRGRRAAIDLVLGWRRRGRGGGLTPVLCIDVKRRDGADYEPDLDRLARIRKTRPRNWRGFVVVTSQGARPDEFVDEHGKAHRGVLHTEKAKTPYRVRRVCKALYTLSTRSKRGYWVCLLEIE